MSKAREHFRSILARATCTPAAPIFDPLSARIADMLGWEVCKLSGSVGKFANLAVPDSVPMSNMSDLVDLCWRISRVANVCLIADADEGGGNALNIMRTVRELEAAGVSAIEIEDNLVPRRFGGSTSRHSLMISKEEQVGKLRAAAAARRDPTTVIVARTSALTELPLDEALDRIRAYSHTGAEAIMLPGVRRGRADIEAAHQATNLPLCVLGLPLDLVNDSAFLAANRVQIRFLGQPTYGMAVKAIYDSLKHLKDGGAPEKLMDRQASAELLRAVDRTEEFKEWEQEYVRE
ncbi:MAG: isocitrate lyase/PEP mutase family protein [Dehalococcoidia bacterium]|nr:isocitrate lyase/PEP mutase family protein [Dehalococcoidia bacterium]